MKLPPELLLIILGCLGPKFFRQDIGRLTVSKKWLDLAWRVHVRDLQLTESSLGKFIEGEAVFARCQPYVVTVKLCLQGHNKFPSRSSSTDPPQSVPDEWASHLNSSLTKLATALQRCPGMRSLEVEARAASLQYQEYLMAKPLADLLSLRHLTSLDFDTASCCPNQAQGSDVHLCCSINILIPSLRRLRCRMDTVCEKLLDLPPGDTPLALEDVIINLSLSKLSLSGTFTTYRFTKRCPTLNSDGFTFVGLRDIMESRLTALASRARRPRIARIIFHRVPSFDICAFDAITGKRSRLKANAEWDAEGEVMVESETDDEDDDDEGLV